MRPAACIVLCVVLCICGCEGGRSEPRYGKATGGDPQRGAQLIAQFHCGSCHTIPGVRAADGVVAPPLNFFSRRTFIAGELPNNFENLVRWLRDPPAVEPGTAMPVLGLTREQARDIAAYLYTLS
jgi:cytochrome c1